LPFADVRAPQAANDNRADPAGDALLRAALRLFAEHGLGAGQRAQTQAEEAFFAGNRASYRWWLAVTRTFDCKLAVELAGRTRAPRRSSRSQPGT
jgi:hypothetical protein